LISLTIFSPGLLRVPVASINQRTSLRTSRAKPLFKDITFCLGRWISTMTSKHSWHE
jgi:hypothetical protein